MTNTNAVLSDSLNMQRLATALSDIKRVVIGREETPAENEAAIGRLVADLRSQFPVKDFPKGSVWMHRDFRAPLIPAERVTVDHVSQQGCITYVYVVGERGNSFRAIPSELSPMTPEQIARKGYALKVMR